MAGLQIRLRGPSFRRFLTQSAAMGLQIVKNLSSRSRTLASTTKARQAPSRSKSPCVCRTVVAAVLVYPALLSLRCIAASSSAASSRAHGPHQGWRAASSCFVRSVRARGGRGLSPDTLTHATNCMNAGNLASDLCSWWRASACAVLARCTRMSAAAAVCRVRRRRRERSRLPVGAATQQEGQLLY